MSISITPTRPAWKGPKTAERYSADGCALTLTTESRVYLCFEKVLESLRFQHLDSVLHRPLQDV